MSVRFSSGITLSRITILNACSKALEAIENELPEEARSFEAYSYIIGACKEALQEKKVVL